MTANIYSALQSAWYDAGAVVLYAPRDFVYKIFPMVSFEWAFRVLPLLVEITPQRCRCACALRPAPASLQLFSNGRNCISGKLFFLFSQPPPLSSLPPPANLARGGGRTHYHAWS